MVRVLRWKTVTSPDKGFHIVRNQMQGRCPFHVHTHDFAEVFWIESGSGVHLVNEKRLPLEPGELFMIRPHDRHGFRAAENESFTLVNVAFAAQTLRFLRERYFPGVEDCFWTQAELPFRTKLSKTQLDALATAAQRLASASNRRLAIERFLLDLLDDLSSHKISHTAGPLPEWLEKALEQIRRPEHFVAGTRELARLAGRCPEHVTRALKAHLGITATDALNAARLDYAALQLTMTSSKIVDIALDCGFQNLGHFYQLFRERFSFSPRHYRLHHQATLR